MTDFADSEQRLINALERIDYFISRADAPPKGDPTGDAGLQQRLAEAEAEIARLKQENSDLKSGGDKALRAELEALKATRAAEIAALDEIMSGLEKLLATAPRASDAPYAEDVAPDGGDVVAFSGQKGKG